MIARFFTFFSIVLLSCNQTSKIFDYNLGLTPPMGSEILFDGSREMLDSKWSYWDGPRLIAKPPIKWKIVKDPVDDGTVLNTFDSVALGGKYGTADIVTNRKFKDFRLHIEFLIKNKGGNSGVYLQNRYEIQIKDGDSTKHGIGAVINEKSSPYSIYRGLGKWNAYDIKFRAARFINDSILEQPNVTVYFNNKLVHDNVSIKKVWGGPFSGLDGGNNNGFGITPKPGGLKLQSEGHEVLYRNIWIEELNLESNDTSF